MYYQEITLKPTKEIPLFKLWTKVYMQLHLTFKTIIKIYGKGKIGIAFPEYSSKGFGRKIRLFANDSEVLATASILHALDIYADYVTITEIQPLPDKPLKYIMYCRYHPDGSPGQKARRFAKRHEGVTVEEALMFMKPRKNKALPYTQMYSKTTNHRFKLFVEKRESPIPNNSIEYTSYGLSMNGSTVPDW